MRMGETEDLGASENPSQLVIGSTVCFGPIKPKHKVGRKFFAIASNRLVQHARLNAVDPRQVRIQDHPFASERLNRCLNGNRVVRSSLRFHRLSRNPIASSCGRALCNSTKSRSWCHFGDSPRQINRRKRRFTATRHQMFSLALN